MNSPLLEPDHEFEPDPRWLRSKPGVKWSRAGQNVLAAWVADMDFPTPRPVRDALTRFVNGGDLGYPNWTNGTPLREAFARRMSDRYGWSPDPSRVRECTDLIQALQLILHITTAPGDGVALQIPNYPPFIETVRTMHRELVAIPMRDTESGWAFGFDELEQQLRRRDIRVLVLVNPHNPTGRVLTLAELSLLAELAERHNLIVVSDEIHADLTYEPHRHIPIASLGDDIAARTITITSATKAFNIAGARCALMHIGHQTTLDARDAAPPDLYGTPNTLGVVATLAAWADGQDWQQRNLAHLRRNRDTLTARLASQLPLARYHTPEATYLAWIDLTAFHHDDPTDHLLGHARIKLSAGRDFGPGGQQFTRLNFATGAQMLDTITTRLINALNRSTDDAQRHDAG